MSPRGQRNLPPAQSSNDKAKYEYDETAVSTGSYTFAFATSSSQPAEAHLPHNQYMDSITGSGSRLPINFSDVASPTEMQSSSEIPPVDIAYDGQIMFPRTDSQEARDQALDSTEHGMPLASFQNIPISSSLQNAAQNAEAQQKVFRQLYENEALAPAELLTSKKITKKQLASYCRTQDGYVCMRDGCTKILKDQTQWNRHVFGPDHTGLWYVCPHCLRAFNRQDSLKRHGPKCPMGSVTE